MSVYTDQSLKLYKTYSVFMILSQVKAKIEIRSHKRYAATRDCSFLLNILPFVRGNKNSRPGENETVKDVCGECGLLGENPLIIV